MALSIRDLGIGAPRNGFIPCFGMTKTSIYDILTHHLVSILVRKKCDKWTDTLSVLEPVTLTYFIYK